MQWASEEMKGDRELCTAAVTQDGPALEFASQEMKNYTRVVTAAIMGKDEHSGAALEYASQDVKSNREIVLVAVQKNPYVLQFASREMKNDATVLAAVELGLQDGDYNIPALLEEWRNSWEIAEF